MPRFGAHGRSRSCHGREGAPPRSAAARRRDGRCGHPAGDSGRWHRQDHDAGREGQAPCGFGSRPQGHPAHLADQQHGRGPARVRGLGVRRRLPRRRHDHPRPGQQDPPQEALRGQGQDEAPRQDHVRHGRGRPQVREGATPLRRGAPHRRVLRRVALRHQHQEPRPEELRRRPLRVRHPLHVREAGRDRQGDEARLGPRRGREGPQVHRLLRRRRGEEGRQGAPRGVGAHGAPRVPVREAEPERPGGRGHQRVGRQAPRGYGSADLQVQVNRDHHRRSQEGQRPQRHQDPPPRGGEAVPPGQGLGRVQHALHAGRHGGLRRHGHPGHGVRPRRRALREEVHARPGGRVPGRLADAGGPAEGDQGQDGFQALLRG